MTPVEPTRSGRPTWNREIGERASVSLVVPLLNEADHLADLLGDIGAQTYPGIREIFLVDGGSTDGSTDLLVEAWARDPRIFVVHNPRRSQAAALNIGFGLATSDIVMRLDGHARYADDVVERCVGTLERTGAGGTGAIARPQAGRTTMGRSIVLAHESRLGIGGSDFRQEGAEGWVDTVWNGCYWRHVVHEVGPFREDLDRVEDNDFHARLRQHGFGLYLDPTVHASYVSRQDLRGLSRQYRATGHGVARALPATEGAISVKHLVPAVFVAAMALLTAVAIAIPATWGSLAIAVVAYLLGIGCAVVAAIVRGRSLIAALALFIVLPVLHVSYGVGTLRGLISLISDQPRPPGAQSDLDTRLHNPGVDLGWKRRTRFAVRLCDIVLGGLAALALIPIFSLMAGAVAITSPGPALYRAVRIGRDGAPFEVLKFRTMQTGADQAGSGVTVAADPRITDLGSILRKFKIDELPQLINVVVGEMSLVGPRPEDARFIAHYSDDERRLLTLRPGITSPASLAYRNESELLAGDETGNRYIDEIMPAKLAVDLAAFDRFTFGDYLWVLLQTIAGIAVSPEQTPPDHGGGSGYDSPIANDDVSHRLESGQLTGTAS